MATAEPSSATAAEGAALRDSPPTWKKLTWNECAALAVLAVATLAIAWPRLPRGICVGDAGDLQLAATVLGIPHPPGYAAYVSLAHLFTYLPGVDPAYMVSVGCMIAGVVALVLCALLAIRMGTEAWTASAAAFCLTSHSRVWQNLTTPEVYIFSIAFVTAAVYGLARYALTGRRWSLYLAAFLFGVAMANRPPVLAAAPFFVAGWWLARRRWESGVRSAARALGLVLAWAMLPVAYSFSYLYLRDDPGTRYNYIEQHNAESGELPETQAGASAKVERVIWIATGKQFHYRVGNTWKQVKTKVRWLRLELTGYAVVAPIALALMVVGGISIGLRQCPAATVALCGVAIQGTFFILSYQDFGQAADILPLLIPLTVLAATATTALVSGRGAAARRVLALGSVALATFYTARDLPERKSYGNHIDAAAYLEAADLRTFPQDAVIFSHWTHALPLLYERTVRTPRPDISVVIAQPINWLPMTPRFEGRPMFVVRDGTWVRGREITPFRNLWRLGPPIAAPPN